MLFDKKYKPSEYRHLLTLIVLFSVVLLRLNNGLMLGILMMVLLMNIMAVNLTTISAYIFLFGMQTLGIISILFGYPGIGGKIALIAGIICLFKNKKFLHDINFNKTIAWPIWSICVLIVFYYLGPQDDYGRSKIIDYIINGALYYVAFKIILFDDKVDLWELGVLGIVSGFIYFITCITILPEVRPATVFDFGSIRDDVNNVFSRNAVSYVVSLGYVILMTGTIKLKHISRFGTGLFFGLTALVLFMLSYSGARFYLLVIPILQLIYFIMVNNNKKLVILPLIFTISIVVAFFVIGLNTQSTYALNILNDGLPFADRFNRSTNWNAAIQQFLENPILGKGLGGLDIFVYVQLHGVYAHNLFLELLSETGLAGTLLLLLPLTTDILYISKYTFKYKNTSYVYYIPVFCFFFMQSMIDYDIGANVAVFVLVLLVARYLRHGKESYAKGHYFSLPLHS